MEKPHISSPCSEDYSNMSPAENGRFCSTCCKVVIDFTKKTAQEILGFLQLNSGTCGRFRNSQLATVPIENKRKFSKRIGFFSLALYFVFGTLLFSTESCTAGEAQVKKLQDSTSIADSFSKAAANQKDSVQLQQAKDSAQKQH